MRWPNWIKRLVAGEELEELARIRVAHTEARRWLAEFKPARAALDFVMAEAMHGGQDISDLREELRGTTISRFQIEECERLATNPPTMESLRRQFGAELVEQEMGTAFYRARLKEGFASERHRCEFLFQMLRYAAWRESDPPTNPPTRS